MSLSSRLSGLDADVQQDLMAGWGDRALMWACIALGAVFVVLALLPPRYNLLKIGALCWAVLP